MSSHLRLLTLRVTCNCQHVKPPANERLKLYINDQAHRYTGYYTSTTLRSGPRPLQWGDSSFVKVVAAFHVGLRSRRREVQYYTESNCEDAEVN